jgi:glycosyltransferase involved in cell wall biosynthesis
VHLAYFHYQTRRDTALNHVFQFTDAARTLGHRVDVNAMNLGGDGTGDAPGFRARARRALKSRFSRFLHEPKEIAANAGYVVAELRALRGRRPEVMLVRNHYLTASCVATARISRLPLVLEVNAPPEEASLYRDQYWHVPWLPRRLERTKLHASRMVVCVSDALKQHLVRNYGIDPDRAVVAPNGADTDAFRPDVPSDPEAVARLRPGVVVGFVGSFQKWHGTDLLRALLATAGADASVRFLLVGDGPELAALRRSCGGLLESRAMLTGAVPHERVPSLVATMDVAVIPDAGFYMSPLKLFEYMAAGKAVVAPAYGPIEEVVEHGVDGLLFGRGDAAALSSAVGALAADAGARRRLGAAAAAKIRSRFRWRDNAEKVVAACRRAVAETVRVSRERD